MAEVIFCKCGHIHVVSDEQINKAIESNKDHLLICAACGATYAIGADYMGSEEGYYMHRYKLNEGEIMSPDNIKERFSEVVYSKGYAVPMMNGCLANRKEILWLPLTKLPNRSISSKPTQTMWTTSLKQPFAELRTCFPIQFGFALKIGETLSHRQPTQKRRFLRILSKLEFEQF